VQHAVLAIAFTVLVVTGFSLRFYKAWWATLLFGHEGGYAVRGIIHRVAGVLLLAGSVWHIAFLLTRRGRVFLRDMWPQRADFAHFFQMIRYNLGRTDHHPSMARFTYVEKAEYWALVWGSVVMIITGIMRIYSEAMLRLWPKVWSDVAQVVHYYEAVLATLAIVVWHAYWVVFDPAEYPMNPSWLIGTRASQHGHPTDAVLDAPAPEEPKAADPAIAP